MATKAKPKPKKKRLPRSKYNQEELTEIFSRFRELRPEPKGELMVADTPEKMLALGQAKVGEYIKTIGLWRNKAKNVIALSQMLVDDFDSVVPETREELVKLPGVGRKTANVVMSMAFGIPTMAVDTHILRIGTRMGLAPAKTPDDVEAILMKIIPEEFLYHAHHWLILHGRYMCVARKPKCEACIVADLCKSKEKTCDVPAPIIPILDQEIPI